MKKKRIRKLFFHLNNTFNHSSASFCIYSRCIALHFKVSFPLVLVYSWNINKSEAWNLFIMSLQTLNNSGNYREIKIVHVDGVRNRCYRMQISQVVLKAHFVA